ncbi:hypothetical protein SKAU_G00065330 [Synaphobranchus kaupii]|uniref:Uncharacterized protein n=1 Tax=Synaphobranchus kaupii TaxID=118154 RepID=A0A9Q1G5N0_SYNKA|nr:hypothetical protein SKAU_G00065330 [Synaphobranchus kaupii]
MWRTLSSGRDIGAAADGRRLLPEPCRMVDEVRRDGREGERGVGRVVSGKGDVGPDVRRRLAHSSLSLAALSHDLPARGGHLEFVITDARICTGLSALRTHTHRLRAIP